MPEVEIEETTQEEITATDYLKNLQAVKDTMVSKDDYTRLQAENKKLADALMSGDFYKPEEPKEEVDVQALRNKLFNPNVTTNDLEMWTDTLKLRDALLEANEPDPFLPMSKDYIPSEEDLRNAERVAVNIRECIEYADGDPAVFRNELQRRCAVKSKLK